MAKKSDLMGLGESFAIARRMATEPSQANSQGASRASATVIGGDQFFISVTGSNSGSSMVLPGIGGDTGALLGDDFIINNQITATIQVFGPTGTTISVSGNNVSGSAGIDIQTHTTMTFYPITATSWLGIRSA